MWCNKCRSYKCDCPSVAGRKVLGVACLVVANVCGVLWVGTGVPHDMLPAAVFGAITGMGILDGVVVLLSFA